MNFHRLYIGDSLQLIPKYIENNSVNLVVTSPPYGLYKKYGKYNDQYDIDNWIKMIEIFGKQSFDILSFDGSIFVNVSPIPAPKTKEIIPLDNYVYTSFKKCGFLLRNKIIWHFNNMQNCTNRLSGRWETILWFVKDINNYKFNLNDIRLPYITKKDKRLTGNGRNPTDVWYFDRVNNMTKKKLGITHPTVYPDLMIERIIKMSSDKGDKILDPFVGSGTTMMVAKKLERNSIGFEIDPKYESIIKQRINEITTKNKHVLKVIQ